MKRIKIFDTTLRDGEQSPGCSMNLAEKIEMAKQLEKLGVDIRLNTEATPEMIQAEGFDDATAAWAAFN